MDKILKKSDLEKNVSLDDQLQMNESTDMFDDGRKIYRPDTIQARTEAEKIMAKAVEEAEAIKKRARDIYSRVEEVTEEAKQRGYDAGREEGLSEATEIIVAANNYKENMLEEMEPEIISLVYDIAEKVIGKDLRQRDTSVVDLIRQALYSAMGSKILILVNSEDLDVVRKNQPLLIQSIEAGKTIQIRADDKVSPKGCIIETEVGTIDARLEVQLEAIRKALGVSEANPENSGDLFDEDDGE